MTHPVLICFFAHILRYKGSLTSPPCQESVVWTVMKEPAMITEKQLQQFYRLSYNNRYLNSSNNNSSSSDRQFGNNNNNNTSSSDSHIVVAEDEFDLFLVGNNRDLQKMNGREVYENVEKGSSSSESGLRSSTVNLMVITAYLQFCEQ